MKKVMAYLLPGFVMFIILSGAVESKEEINWLSISQLNEQYAKAPKPILIDVYTDWCGWCRHMDRTTYRNRKLVSYVNEHYYAVKLNAESKETLRFDNKDFGYDALNRANDLAKYLLFNRMEFPSTVFLPAMDARPAPLAGYLKPKEMEGPLRYFGEGIHKDQTFVEFNKSFRASW